ncbi:MAG: bifunctional biotin--[acetyl-CoA-carboxylase] ligase/biotin operon repressor BirA [Gammaproteobacteria bacterium]|nr:bifunctional biotin--[acetyl-CoA-carboxylase] ligase/biotin operon repressor BirA [Gammaproteobacteria bacterium]MDP2347869.1 bifunctional biotin--[acetyl-CoA-carboxylase] ligase/biotin operon repressor BirA [Gammaproteobacteria bacterium]
MDLRPLLTILSDGLFHSGEQLGRGLGLSRAAVWKQVEKLKSMGVEVHSVIGKGYRLPSALEFLCDEKVFLSLGAESEKWRGNLSVVFSVDSTNTEVLRRMQPGVERHIVVADHQALGRGRRGRVWVSPLGANIYMSIAWSFQAGVAALEGLSLVVAVLIVKALGWCGYDGMTLKWPNDILLDGRKLAGILLEVSGDLAGPCRVVIGVGVNIRMPDNAASQIDQPYTDLFSNFGAGIDRNVIAAAMIRELSNGLEEFERTGFATFHARWDQLDANKGRIVELRTATTVTRGLVMGVDRSGALILETAEGVKAMAGGELQVSLRPVADEISHDS